LGARFVSNNLSASESAARRHRLLEALDIGHIQHLRVFVDTLHADRLKPGLQTSQAERCRQKYQSAL
jgi:hypothetical protein